VQLKIELEAIWWQTLQTPAHQPIFRAGVVARVGVLLCDWCCRVASLLGVDWRLSRRARCRILEGRRILLGCEAEIRTDGAQLPHLVTPADTQTGSLLQPGP
jgi:hypothetical protein